MANEKLIVEIVLDDGTVQKSFASVERQGEKSGRKVGKAFSSAFTSSFAKIAGTIGSLLAIRQVTDDFLSFESAVAEVRTITQGLAIDQDELNDTLITTSQQFGTSASEQAKSFYQIISAGVTDATKSTELLTAANKLAIGGLTTTQGAIDLLTSSVNAFGQENLSAERASDILFGTVKLGKTRIEELQSSLGQILPSAKAIGVSFEDVNGALAQLTIKGLSTSEAVTQLGAVFTAIFKKQDMARILGVSKAFSIQALQTKGLTVFLKDLNVALGGSQTKLVKLLGRVEGAKAIMSLGSDNFEGMANKVNELKNSFGAADTAFNEINKTVGQKLKIIFSIITGSILRVTSALEGPLATALDSVITLLSNTNGELTILLNTAIRLTGVLVSLGAAFAINAAVTALIPAIGLLIGAFTKAAIAIGTFKITMLFDPITGQFSLNMFKMVTSLKLFVAGINKAKLAVNIFKAALTLGLVIAFDILITKFLELQEKTQSIGDTFSAIGLKIKIGFLMIIRDIIEELAFNMPIVLETMGIDASKAFEKMSKSIALAKKDLRAMIAPIKEVGKALDESIDPKKEKPKLEEVTKVYSDMVKSLDGAIRGKLVGMISGAMQMVGASLVKGASAFKDFKSFIFNILGDLAIQMGGIILAMGIALTGLKDGLTNLFTGGAAAIAGGIALIALGGALKAMGTGGSENPPITDGGSNLGGGTAEEEGRPLIDNDLLENLNQNPTEIIVNVEGNLVDPRGAAIAISELLQEQFESNGSTVVVG